MSPKQHASLPTRSAALRPQRPDHGLWIATKGRARPSSSGLVRQPAGLWKGLAEGYSSSSSSGSQAAVSALRAKSSLKVQTAVRQLQVERAAERRAKQLTRLDRAAGEGPLLLGRTLLEEQIVTHNTKRGYLRRVAAFLDYAAHEHLPSLVRMACDL